MKEKKPKYSFDADLKEKLKDPYFKGGWDAWDSALRDEIKPRDKEIQRLEKKLQYYREEIDHLTSLLGRPSKRKSK